MSKIGILGMGYNVPKKILTNQDLEKMVETSDEWITQRSGIKERHINNGEYEGNSDMIIPACERAIAEAGIDRNKISLIAVGTVTPDFLFPSTAAMVQKKLGIPNAMVFDFEAGCTGFVYGLEIIKGLFSSGNHEYALLVGSEQLSKITNWAERATCVLFGDGAGAAVIGKRDDAHEIIDVMNCGDGNLGDILVQPAGGSVKPSTHETVDGKLHFIEMSGGSEVFKNAITFMSEISKKLLERNGLKTEDVDWLIPHQANIRIMDKVGERLGIAREKVVITIDKFGNTSAGSIPIAMGVYLGGGQIKKGQLLLLTAFGAGFTWGSALIRW